MKYTEIPQDIFSSFQKGMVIPALPLALNKNRELDERRQRALMRYYLDAGAGGVAVAVHTTQFEIRLPEYNLYEPILQIAKEEFDNYTRETAKPIMRIAGVIGKTAQALAEAQLAKEKGFHAVLLGVAAFKDASNEEILEHCKAVAEIIPVVGFYLQPAVGGRRLDVDFWREFAQIENVIAIKMAPFNRYYTFDVVRGVVESGRSDEISLYTGNDDNILVDLLAEYKIEFNGETISKKVVGGLLGHWAVWTRAAVQLLENIQRGKYSNDVAEALILANQITDSNAAFFDVAYNFSGCITGIHEVLRRQGLLEGIWTLNEAETLSPGQKEEIDRVYASYPHLNDDEFIKKKSAKMVKLRTLTVNDIDKAVELSSAEKWNQTEADWEFLISTPENICLAAVDEGKIVGTATATVYNNDVAWIGMVLVNKNFRGKGISKLLLLELFEKLKHCCSIKLDATPVGQPVYQKFGFENEYNIFRLTNPAVVLNLDDNECGSPIEKFCRKDILEAAGLDCQVFGADRKYLLEYLYKNNPDNSWMIKRGGKVDGIVMGRKGTRYFQVGPLLTESVACGKALLLKVLKDLEGQAVVIDVPFFNKDFLVWLILLGFTIQRPFYRMYQHKNPYPGIPQNQFLISGPEFG